MVDVPFALILFDVVTSGKGILFYGETSRSLIHHSLFEARGPDSSLSETFGKPLAHLEASYYKRSI